MGGKKLKITKRENKFILSLLEAKCLISFKSAYGQPHPAFGPP